MVAQKDIYQKSDSKLSEVNKKAQLLGKIRYK